MSIHALELRTLAGEPLDGARLCGRATLIVNVASRCGLTPQYTGMEQLYEELHPRGLEVVGVPCNQFAGQEPGTPEEIASFCSTTYGVTFPLLEKQDVNGPGRSPLYRALVDSPAGGGADIQWNFEKFLIGPGGDVVARFAPTVTPDDPQLRAAIEGQLAGPTRA